MTKADEENESGKMDRRQIGSKAVIPVMHCFNNNYVIPASVAFYSMIEHASKDFEYHLYVLHSDITEENKNKLIETISCFKNCSLQFIDMHGKFEDLFEKTSIKGHYSREIYYKFLVAEIFQQYDKMIVTDVDVVYLGDISDSYFIFDSHEDIYFAGHRGPVLRGSWIEENVKNYRKNFSDSEIEKLTTGAGYYVFNLRKIREDNMTEKFIETTKANIDRIMQPEQDVINLCCSPKIRYLPFRNMVCTYCYDLYKTESDLNNDLYYSKEELQDGLEHPIQLHYATSAKPWNLPSSTKASEWFKVLVKTRLLPKYLEYFINFNQNRDKIKTLFSINISISRKKHYLLELKKNF
jgi:lipopolysaccharide biosynthesis glycosyltransferase